MKKKNLKGFTRHHSESGFVQIILILLIVAVAIGVVGYFSYKNSFSKSIKLVQIFPNPSNSPSSYPAPSPVEGQLIIDTNSTLIPFDYPKDVYPLKISDSFILFFSTQSDVNLYKKYCLENKKTPDNSFMCPSNLFSVGFGIQNNSQIDSSNNFKKFVDLQNRSWASLEPVIGMDGSFNYYFELQKNQSIYSIGIIVYDSKYKEVKNQILSTFKFTNQ